MTVEESKVKILPVLKRHEVTRAGLFGSRPGARRAQKAMLTYWWNCQKKPVCSTFPGLRLT